MSAGEKMTADIEPGKSRPAPDRVVVTNKNPESYARKFDGTLYTFPPDEAVTVPVAAARFLFAFGGTDADRARIIVRNGWQKTSVPGDAFGPEAAQQRLKNFIFRNGPKAETIVREKKRLPTGVNAVSEKTVANNDGRKILPSTVRLPGSPQRLAPATGV